MVTRRVSTALVSLSRNEGGERSREMRGEKVQWEQGPESERILVRERMLYRRRVEPGLGGGAGVC